MYSLYIGGKLRSTKLPKEHKKRTALTDQSFCNPLNILTYRYDKSIPRGDIYQRRQPLFY